MWLWDLRIFLIYFKQYIPNYCKIKLSEQSPHQVLLVHITENTKLDEGVARILYRRESASWGGAGHGPEWGVPTPKDAWNFSKFFKNFLKNSVKMHYFSLVPTKVCKPFVNFSCVWTKITNSLEIFEKCEKVWWKDNRKFDV